VANTYTAPLETYFKIDAKGARAFMGQFRCGVETVNPTRLRTLIPDTGTHIPGMTLPRRAWVRFNHLRTGVGRFRSCLYK